MSISALNKKLLYIIFTLSGFCALVYEILWTKYLSLTLGNTMIAVSLVAATFMAGLAIGSFLIGRFSDRKGNLLFLYGVLEVGICLTALLFAPTLNILEGLYVYWSQRLPDHPLIVTSVNLIFSSFLILPPTICMGGTFPLMCRFFAREKSGGQIGRLYALNTFGATVGAFWAGYILIPHLGLSRTGFVAIFGNLAVAAVSFWISQKHGAVDAEGGAITSDQSSQLKITPRRSILISIGLVGFFSLAYEILWTRVLLLFLGNTTYAFSLMLSAYLVGIALGGIVYAKLVRPSLDEKRLFKLLATGMGITVLATAPFYDKLAYLFQAAHETAGSNWLLLSWFNFLIVFMVISIPTILSGALLPAAVAIVDPGKRNTGIGVGLVVLHNTVGAVLGSLLAGFFMIPWFGLLHSFQLLAGMNLLLVLFLTFHYRSETPPGKLIPTLAAAGLLLLFLPFHWNPHLVNSGVYCYAQKYAKMGGMDQILANENILEVIEGSETTVAVHESLDGNIRFFSVNGKTDGGTGPDMATQLLIGQLPMLLHPKPDKALVIGLGTGITLRGMSAHPGETVNVVEISPEVVEAERYFREENGNALKDPEVTLYVDDGRNLLFKDPTVYDVIISEPSNPWQVGNANLFTKEFYQLAASRMTADGLFCQWVGMYDITEDNLRIVTKTFLDTFPRALVFRVGADMILIGAKKTIPFDITQMRQRFAIPGVRETLEIIDIRSPGDLIAKHFLFTENSLVNFSNVNQINTDDMPVLEYSARHYFGEHTVGELDEQNLIALFNDQEKRLVFPLINLGESKAEQAANLRAIGRSYAVEGQRYIAGQFMRRAASLLD